MSNQLFHSTAWHAKLINFNTFQVQSLNQYKYLHACVSSYAKEIEEQKNNNDEDVYVYIEVKSRRRSQEDVYVYIP